MLIQFKRGPKSAIETQSLLAGEPAFATDTRELFVGDGFTIGGVSISALGGSATYIAQGTTPPNPSDPVNAKVFWYNTTNSYLYVWKYTSGAGSWERVLATGPTGPAGPTGPQGAQGIQGIQGLQGIRGATIITGTGNPTTSTVAIDGDYYLNTTSKELFGPRTTTNSLVSWGTGISLKGDKGDTGNAGPTGAEGPVGPRGATIHYGNQAPTSSFPSPSGINDGDFYFDLVAKNLYGGYVAANGTPWGAPISLVGPSGPAGSKGDSGPAGTPGLVWKGSYVSGTQYPLHSVVQFNGSSYVVIATAGTTNAPTNAADWNLVASKGSTANAVATIYANAPIVWDEQTTTLSFNVPNAQSGNVLKYDGTNWVASKASAAKSLQTGTAAPDANTDATDGDWYIQTAGTGAPLLYGPRTTANSVVSWGTGISLVGPAGANGANGSQGAAGADGKAGMEWNGAYDKTVNYSKGAVVQYGGGIYICEENNTIDITPNTTGPWDLLVSKGEQGDPADLQGTAPITISSETNNGVVTFTVALSDGTTTGEVLTWNNTSKTWTPQSPIVTLDGLTDVTITSPEQDQILVFKNNEWVNHGTYVDTLDELQDVIITSPTQDEILKFDGTNWVNSTAILEINATTPLDWDKTTGTLSIKSGTKDGNVITWDDTFKEWKELELPPADINAAQPLDWDAPTRTLTFGVNGNAGDVLVYDGVNWIASVPYDHSRPTILWGDGAPAQDLGNSGDFYIDTTNHILYGPKCSGCLGNRWTSIQEPVNLVGPQGVQGVQGDAGPVGPAGPTGATGPRGQSTSNLIRRVDHPVLLAGQDLTSIYSGIGVNGDFMLVSILQPEPSTRFFGPKANNAWPSNYVELHGETGATGAAGPTGPQGPAGPQSGQIIHHATVTSNASIPPDPSSTLGAVGDFHITRLETTLGEYIGTYIFGPKTSSATDPWGAPTNLRGPIGDTGATGPQGPQGISPDPTLADSTGGLANTGTTQNPTLAIRTRSGTGLVLDTVPSSPADPNFYLKVNTESANALAVVNNKVVVKQKPVNAGYRRGWFGI